MRKDFYGLAGCEFGQIVAMSLKINCIRLQKNLVIGDWRGPRIWLQLCISSQRESNRVVPCDALSGRERCSLNRPCHKWPVCLRAKRFIGCIRWWKRERETRQPEQGFAFSKLHNLFILLLLEAWASNADKRRIDQLDWAPNLLDTHWCCFF